MDPYLSRAVDTNISRMPLMATPGISTADFMLPKSSGASSRKLTNREFAIMDLPLERGLGEITGGTLGVPEIDQGMPMRSNIREQEREKRKITTANTRFDFSVHDEPSTLRVNYNDTGNETGFASVTGTQSLAPIRNATPTTLCSDLANSFSVAILRLLQSFKEDTFICSPLMTNFFFSFLYAVSKGKTEKIIQETFSYPNKQILIDGFENIRNSLPTNSTKLFNILFYNDDITTNRTTQQEFHKFIKYKPIDENISKNGKTEIEEWVNGVTGIDFNLPPTLTKDNSLFNFGFLSIDCRLCYDFNTEVGIFHRTHKKSSRIKMLSTSYVTIKHFEDQINQFAEFQTKSNNIVFGIILNKKNESQRLSYEYIKNGIDSLVNTTVDIVKIPVMALRQKMKITSIIKKLGLFKIFEDMNLREWTKDDVKLTGTFHDIIITVSDGGKPKQVEPGNHRKITGFIVEHSFTFYVRERTTDTILALGMYI